MNRENLGTFVIGFGAGILSVGTVVCGLYFYRQRKSNNDEKSNDSQ